LRLFTLDTLQLPLEEGHRNSTRLATILLVVRSDMANWVRSLEGRDFAGDILPVTLALLERQQNSREIDSLRGRAISNLP
jgi:hypothetical protein